MKINRDDVEFSLTCHPETEPWEGNVMASGDDEVDSYAEEWVRDQLEWGNEWAWCQVCVTAELEGFKGTAWLGGCSYESEDQFTIDGYYTDLCDEAFEDLVRNISETKTRIVKIENL